MGVESVERFMNPTEINFNSAIGVSIIGFIVNVLSALLLWDSHDHHHHHDHDDHVHDHNHQSALVHVIADALTSVLAIAALFLGKYLGWTWADPIMGIVGAVVILKWAYGLCKATVWELLDGNSKLINREALIKTLTETGDAEILDLHVWRIAPGAHACEIILESKEKKGHQHYRDIIKEKFEIQHIVIEEREK